MMGFPVLLPFGLNFGWIVTRHGLLEIAVHLGVQVRIEEPDYSHQTPMPELGWLALCVSQSQFICSRKGTLPERAAAGTLTGDCRSL